MSRKKLRRSKKNPLLLLFLRLPPLFPILSPCHSQSRNRKLSHMTDRRQRTIVAADVEAAATTMADDIITREEIEAQEERIAIILKMTSSIQVANTTRKNLPILT